jgi:hypothetical protein
VHVSNWKDGVARFILKQFLKRAAVGTCLRHAPAGYVFGISLTVDTIR